MRLFDWYNPPIPWVTNVQRDDMRCPAHCWRPKKRWIARTHWREYAVDAYSQVAPSVAVIKALYNIVLYRLVCQKVGLQHRLWWH